MNALLLLRVLLACDPPDPVLSGIPEGPLLAAPPTSDVENDQPEPVEAYVKPPEVHVDIRHLCGQQFDAVRADLIEQLGERQRVRVLDAVRGREIQYERGRVRVLDGVVYMMSVPLNEPMYRRVAFERTGFPAFSGNRFCLPQPRGRECAEPSSVLGQGKKKMRAKLDKIPQRPPLLLSPRAGFQDTPCRARLRWQRCLVRSHRHR